MTLNRNNFFNLENTSKYCAEGSVKNLLHMLGLNDANVTLFWQLSTCPLTELRMHINEDVPKIVVNGHGVMNSIEKCLWILRKKFNFRATKKMKSCHFDNLTKTLQNLALCHFPVLLSVNSTNAAYDHVIVIWQEKIIDYESEYICDLNKGSLNRVCGQHTSFNNVSCGYGLFPPLTIQALLPIITNWGCVEYFEKNLKVRSLFKRK